MMTIGDEEGLLWAYGRTQWCMTAEGTAGGLEARAGEEPEVCVLKTYDQYT